MIGRVTETALTSLALALTFEQACWPQDLVRYDELRDEAQRLIRELGLEGVVVPERQEELLAGAAAVTFVAEGDAEVMAALGELKATLVAEGVDPERAEELTAGDPQGLWELLVRWFGGAQAGSLWPVRRCAPRAPPPAGTFRRASTPDRIRSGGGRAPIICFSDRLSQRLPQRAAAQ
jgi:hypothetical protein